MISIRNKTILFALLLLTFFNFVFLMNPEEVMTAEMTSNSTNMNHAERRPLVIITMTSVPTRLAYELPIALESILKYQTYSNLHIFLAIAENDFAAFEKNDMQILKDPRITIQAVQDYGAAKKFIPAIEKYKNDPDQILMTLDDDFFYSTTLVEDLVEQFLALNPTDPTADSQRKAVGVLGYRNKADLTWGENTIAPNWYTFSEFTWYYVRGFRIRKPYQTGIATGGGGVMFKASWLANSTISDFSNAPPHARIVDDIWLNGHLSLNGVLRYVVPVRDFAYSVVRSSVVEQKLDHMNRYEANTDMMHYFRDTFTKEDIFYQQGGMNHPEYNSYFSIGVIEPIVERLKGIWIHFTFGDSPKGQ